MEVFRRRRFLQVGGMAVGSSLLLGIDGSLILLESGCDASVEVEIGIAQGALGIVAQVAEELKLKSLATLAGKSLAVMNDVQRDYHAGKFDSALSFLHDLVGPDGLFNELLADVGVQQNSKVKAALLILNGALRVIDIVLAAQMQASPQATAAVAAVEDAGGPRAKKVAQMKRIAASDALYDALLVVKF